MAGSGAVAEIKATSAARVEANRRNAKKSTGPRTAEGKARSRGNAVKHGLTGRGIALLGEDAAAVEARFATLQAEERPSGLMGQLLLHQVALASVRVERAAKLEAAALEPLIRHAAEHFERDRLAEVDRLFDTIETCPGDHRRRLMAQPEGVDKLAAALRSARDQLKLGVARRWSESARKQVEALFGGTMGQFPVTRTDALMFAIAGHPFYFPADERPDLKTKDDWAAWATAELIAEVDAELARLADARAALDPDAIDRDRHSAADRAGVAPDPGLALARKYAAAASRDFARAYRDHRRAAEDDRDAEVADDAPAPVPHEPNPPPAEESIAETTFIPPPPASDAPAPVVPDEPIRPAVAPVPAPVPAVAPVAFRVEPNAPTSLRPRTMRFPDDFVPDRPHYGEIRVGSEPRAPIPSHRP